MVSPFEALEKRSYMSADLILTSAVLSVDIIKPGGKFDATWSGKNIGDSATTTAWHDSVFYSEDAVLDENDRYLGDHYYGYGLGPQASYNAPSQLTALELPAGAKVGTGYVLFKVDGYGYDTGGGYQPESNEDNNVVAKPITVADPGVDLRPQNVAVNGVGVTTSPVQVKAHADVSVTFTVVNTGPNASYAGSWYDSVFFSTDATFNPSEDRELDYGYFTPDPVLAGNGGSYEQTLSVRLPDPTPLGPGYLFVVVDANGDQGDSDRTNNVVRVPINLVAPDVNLQVTDASVTGEGEGPIRQTGGIVINWTVTNVGTERAQSARWYDSFYYSTDSILDASDIQIDYQSYYNTDGEFLTTPSGLAGGGHYSDSTYVQLPRSVPAGGGFILIATDRRRGNVVDEPTLAAAATAVGSPYDNRQAETDETDNVRAVPINVEAIDNDLTVVAASASKTGIRMGESFTVTWTGRNTGTTSTVHGISGRLVLSFGDEVYDSSDETLTYWYHGAVGAGGEYGQVDYQVALPDVTQAGGAYLLFITDDYDDNLETNEDNNVRSFAITVLPPDVDLRVDSFDVPATAQSGQYVYVSWDGRNAGTSPTRRTWTDRIYFSTDAQFDAGDTELGARGFYSSLSGGGTYRNDEGFALPAGLADGTYYIILRLNADGDQPETDGGNNVAVRAITIGRSDLVLSNVGAPASGAPGQVIPVSWTVTNRGTATTANAWYDVVYLSKDNIFGNADDEVIQSFYRPSALDPASTSPGTSGYTVARDLTLPYQTQFFGTQYLIFVTQGEGTETNAGDNVVTVPFTVNGGNLVVQNATVTPTSGATGMTVDVSFDVVNVGNATLSKPNYYPNYSWADSIYLSTDASWDGYDTRLDTVFSSSPNQLEPGAKYGINRRLTLPSNKPAGTYYLILHADRDNYYGSSLVSEAGESDNYVAIPVTLGVPDLTVATATAPSVITVGEYLSFSWTVANLGPVPAHGTWYDAVFLSTDGTLDANDTYLTSFWAGSNSPVGPAGSATASYTSTSWLSFPQVAAGSYFLLFVADRLTAAGNDANYDNGQAESDETNNVVARAVTIKTPDLAITQTSAPPAALSSQDVEISWTVKNTSTDAAALATWYDAVYLSKDDIFGNADDVFVGYSSRPGYDPLAAQGAYTITRSFRLPSVVSGAYNLMFATDYYQKNVSSNLQAETDETNNVVVRPITIGAPDLAITATAPDNAIANGKIKVNWTVTNLGASGAAARWYDSVYVSSDTTLSRFDDTRLSLLQRPGTGPVAGNGGAYSRNDVEITIPSFGTGQRYLIFVIDDPYYGGESQGDDNFANNRVVLPISIVSPDLQVTAASASVSTAALGQQIGLTWTVKNGGTTPAPGKWTDRVYLSFDQTLSGNDSFIASYNAAQHSPLPNTTGEYTATASGIIPGPIATGTYYLLVVADSGNDQGESNENNNVRAVPITITAADVQIENFTVLPSDTIYSGGTVTVRWDVVNKGNGPTVGSWTDAVVIRNKANPSVVLASGTLAYDAGTSGALDVNGRVTRQITLKLPDGAAAVGTLAFGLTLDQTSFGQPYGGVLEYNFYAGASQGETNNTGTIERTSEAAKYPDLTVGGVAIAGSGSTPLQSGSPAVVTWNTINAGNKPAQGIWNERVTVRNAAGDILAQKTIRFDHSASAIGADGAAAARSTTVDLPHGPIATGALTVTVEVDTDGELFEAFANGADANGNNTGTGSAVAQLAPYPNLKIVNITAPALARSGSAVTISWTVRNDGPADADGSWTDVVYLSTDNQLGGDTEFKRFSFTGSIAAHSEVTRTQVITLPYDMEGSKYLVVKTGENVSFNEYPKDDNTTIDDAAMVVTLRDFPNLTVPSVTVPAEVFAGQTTVVRWVVKNTGPAATEANWMDSIYLSTDGTIDSLDRLLGQVANVAALTAAGTSGDSYVSEMVVTLPQGIDGPWKILVRSDSQSKVVEFGHENDNDGAANLAVKLPQPPDLYALKYVLPSTIYDGQTYTITWTVSNLGDVITDGSRWTDRLYLSGDDKVDNADLVLGSAIHTGQVQADGSYNVTVTVHLPAGQLGTKYLLFRTDLENAVYESAFEGNNTRPVEITIQPSPPADLEFTGVTPAPAFAGRKWTLNVGLANMGLTPTDVSRWTNAVYLSTDSVFDKTADRLLGKREWVGLINAGDDESRDIDVPIPVDVFGQYYLFVVTDSEGVVFEGDETNNVHVQPVTVGQDRPDLVVTSLTGPQNAISGRPHFVDITLKNTGDGATYTGTPGTFTRFYLSTGSTFGGGILLDTVQRVADLAAGGEQKLVNFPVTIPPSVATGTYYLFAVTDFTGDQWERNRGANDATDGERNNVSAPVRVNVTQYLPDLTVDEIKHPAQAFGDQPLPVAWKDINQGAGAVPGYYFDEVYLSRDGVLGDDDLRLIPGPLLQQSIAALSQRDVSYALTLPATASGNYYVIVKTNANNSVAETTGGAANNVRVSNSQVNIVQVTPPDLRAGAGSVSGPAEVYSNRPANFTWTVTNAGGLIRDDKYWYDSIYLSPDPIFDPQSDVHLGSAIRRGPIGAGGAYTASATLNIPAAGIPGAKIEADRDYYVFVVTNSSGGLVETGSPTNNVGRSAGTVRVSLTPPADLVVGTVPVPSNPVPGASATLTYTVNNIGGNPALGSWYDSVYLSLDETWDINDPLLVRNLHMGDVAAGGSYTHTVTGILPGVIPGDYHVIIRSDILNHIPESNETNNVRASLDRVAIDAEALPTGTSKTGTLANNQAVYYKIVVPAGETLRVVLDSLSATASNELYVRYGAMPTRTDFDFRFENAFAPDQVVTVPTTKAGAYYVMAFGTGLAETVPAQAPVYTISAELVPFGITAVEPASVGNTGLATLRINGAFFDRATQFRLVGPGGQVLNPTAVLARDAATALVTFNLAGAPVGAYTVRATRFNGQVAEAAAAVTVRSDLPAASYSAYIEAPANVVRGRKFALNAAYGNYGGADAIAPLILLTTQDLNAPLAYAPGGVENGRTSILVYGAGTAGQAGILRPGEVHAIPFFSQAPAGQTEAHYQAFLIGADDARPMDWELVRSLVPSQITSSPDFSALWPKLQLSIGTTWGDFVKMLSRNANGMQGERTEDVRRVEYLLVMEVDRVRASVGPSITGKAFAQDVTVDLGNRQVTARNRSTGDVFTTTSLEDGTFIFERVTPGSYEFLFDGAVIASADEAIVTGAAPLTGVHVTLQKGATLTGTVRRSGDNRGLATGRISITGNGRSFTPVVDADGRYFLEGLPAGTYVVSVEAEGRERLTLSLEVNQATIARDFVLQPQLVVNGKVTAPAGTSFDGLRVVAGRVGDSTALFQAVVDRATGAFSFDHLPAGRYTFRFELPGFASLQVNGAEFDAGTTVDLGNVALQRAARIAGTVSSTVSQVPVTRAQLQVLRDGVEVLVRPITAGGQFNLDGLLPATYTLRLITPFGTPSEELALTVGEGQAVTDVQLRILPGGSVTGTVMLTGVNEPLRNAPVWLLKPDGSVVATRTDANGVYRFDGLALGVYDVLVPGLGQSAAQPVAVTAVNGETFTQNLAAQATTRLRGKLVAADGVTGIRGTVELYENGVRILTATSAADGTYEFLLARGGTFDLVAATVSTDASPSRTFERATGVTVGADTVVTRNLTAGTASIAIGVTGPAGSTVGATVTLYRLVGNARVAVGTAFGAASGAAFVNLAAGTYVVSVLGSNGYQASQTVTIAAGQLASANLTLEASSGVSGRVLVATTGGTSAFTGLAGATVLLTSTTNPNVTYLFSAGATGYFTFDYIPAGTYELRAFANGYALGVVPAFTLTAGAGEQVDVVLTATASRLTGRAVDPAGVPVAAANVLVLDAAGRILAMGTTGTDGTFSVTAAPGAVTLRLSGAGRTPLDVAATGTATATSVGDLVVTATGLGGSGSGPVASNPAGLQTRFVGPTLAGLKMPDEYVFDLISAGLDWLQDFASIEKDALHVEWSDIGELECEECRDAYNNLVQAWKKQEDAYWGAKYKHDAVLSLGAGVAAQFIRDLTESASFMAKIVLLLESLGVASISAGAAGTVGMEISGMYAVIKTTYEVLDSAKNVIDFLRAAAAASGSLEEGFDNMTAALKAEAGVFDLVTKLTESFSQVSKNLLEMGGEALPKTLGVLGLLMDLKGAWQAANYEATLDGLAELIDTKNDVERLKKEYLANAEDAYRKKIRYELCLEISGVCDDDEEDDDNDRPDPDKPDGDPDADTPVRFPASRDPNDIIGPASTGDAHWTKTDRALGYTIRFENDQNATAPAQDVTITHQLDSDLDWRTFRIDDFGFSGRVFDLPGDRGFYSTRIEGTDVLGRKFFVDFTATIDVASGTVTFRFLTIDPATGQKPEDPTLGFLPVNANKSGIGEGFVSFTVKPKASTPTGARIDARATIVFDANEPIDTPAIFNTLDRGTPVSTVVTLPGTSDPTFTVRWGGDDDADGSGIAGYDVYVSIDGAAYVLWLENTPLGEADYPGQPGHTYAFYSLSRDLAGNTEVAPVTADARTTVALPNTAPTVDVGPGTATANEGSVFTRDGTFADADLGDVLSGTVDYGDGLGDVPLVLNPNGTFSLSHLYGDNGTYNVTVKVTDKSGAFSQRSIALTVNNVAPTVSQVADATVPFGTPFVAQATFTDPGADTWTATVDYGDGNGAQPLTFGPDRKFTLSNAYAAPGTYTVTVTVTDDDGGVGTQTLRVKVQAPAPTLSGPVRVNDGHVQRSIVKSLTLTFDQAVTFTASGFSVVRRGSGTIVPVTVTADTTGRMLTVSFASLEDGVYDLLVDRNAVKNADGVALGQDVSFAFHRLFGDSDGDRDVDTVDSLRFRMAQGAFAGDAKYISWFDSDNDGDVDTVDSLRFRLRQGTIFDSYQ
jgi:subtilase family serine protease